MDLPLLYGKRISIQINYVERYRTFGNRLDAPSKFFWTMLTLYRQVRPLIGFNRRIHRCFEYRDRKNARETNRLETISVLLHWLI